MALCFRRLRQNLLSPIICIDIRYTYDMIFLRPLQTPLCCLVSYFCFLLVGGTSHLHTLRVRSRLGKDVRVIEDRIGQPMVCDDLGCPFCVWAVSRQRPSLNFLTRSFSFQSARSASDRMLSQCKPAIPTGSNSSKKNPHHQYLQAISGQTKMRTYSML